MEDSVKKRLDGNCKVGKLTAEELKSQEGRIVELEATVASLTDKFDAVLKATSADSAKTLKISTTGKVELVS